VSIAQPLEEVRARVARAEQLAGRPAGSVTLVAVSKMHPAAAIREAYAAGQRDFGENYLQELEDKATELSDLVDLRFHVIGHIQSNKAKLAVRRGSVIHTVDSPSLARELGKRAAGRPGPLPVLIEVNVGGEAQKSGAGPGDLGAVIEAIEAQPALRLRGLMTVPPTTADPEGARPYFARLRALRDEHGGAARLPELSMGMSHDLEVAVAEGATLVRVGTAIFGARQ
jgi:hypothetical protein